MRHQEINEMNRLRVFVRHADVMPHAVRAYDERDIVMSIYIKRRMPAGMPPKQAARKRQSAAGAQQKNLSRLLFALEKN